MIVPIADAIGFDVRKLFPFGGRGTHVNMGQSRGAQSGQAIVTRCGLRPRTGTEDESLDPMAIFDEIQRLVQGYGVSRANLLAGNSEHTSLSNAGPGSER